MFGSDASPSENRNSASLHSNNPKIASCVHLSGITLALGYQRDSEAWIAEAHEEFSFTKDPFDFAVVLHHSTIREVLCRNVQRTIELADRLIAFAAEQGFGQFRAQAHIYRGWAHALTVDPRTGCDEIVGGIEAYKRSGANLNLSLYESLLAEALAACRAYVESAESLDKALRWATHTTESTCGFAAEIHRLTARVIIDQTSPVDPVALRHLHLAIEVARRQKGLAFEARATVDLADRLMAAGRNDEAKDYVSAVNARILPEHSGADIDAIRRLAHRP